MFQNNNQRPSRVQRFMAGRYGQRDKLNSLLLWSSVICVVLSLVMPWRPVSLGLAVAAYALMGYSIFRTFSRNTYKRYRENRRYMHLLERIWDRQHRYYTCPRCRQSVRVPKGKGKIAIACPRCREKFVRKS